MTDAAKFVQRRDALRLALLRRMFDQSNGRTNVGMNRETLYEEIDANHEEGEAASRWLVEEGLARYLGLNLAIEHAGIREVEDSIKHPDRDTEHFSPPVINMVNNFQFHGATIGAVQTGNDASANVQQNIGVQPKEIVELFARLREAATALPDDPERAEVLALVDDFEAEAKKEKRSELKLKTLSAGLTAFTHLAPVVRLILGVLGVHLPG